MVSKGNLHRLLGLMVVSGVLVITGYTVWLNTDTYRTSFDRHVFVLGDTIIARDGMDKVNQLTHETHILQQPSDVMEKLVFQDFLAASGKPHLQLISQYIKSLNVSCDDSVGPASGLTSKLKLLTEDGSQGVVSVFISLYDRHGNPKTIGGDVVFAWAEQVNSLNNKNNVLSRVTGQVIDHMNGSYTARIWMSMPGRYIIKSKIAAKLEVTCRRLKAIEKYGNSVLATKTPVGQMFEFQKGKQVSQTRCNPSPFVHGYSKVCNLTHRNYGLSWYCGHPGDAMDCSDAKVYSTIKYDKKKLVPMQPLFEVINGNIREMLTSTLDLNVSVGQHQSDRHLLPLCKTLSPRTSWSTKVPTGFGHGKGWKSTSCRSDDSFAKDKINKCLENRRVYLFGDSTSRQYMELLNSMTGVTFKTNKQDFFLTSFSKKSNMSIMYRKHDLPFYNLGVRYEIKDVRSIANQILLIADDDKIQGNSLIIMATYHVHLQSFEIGAFRQRIKDLVESFEYLLKRKQGAKLFFKGPHACYDEVKWFDVRIALIYRDIIFEEFAPLQDHVVYLDIFSISVAFNNEDVHPHRDTMDVQMHQFLSYLC